MTEIPKVQHGMFDRANAIHEAGGPEHTDGEATTCWCSPELMTPCVHCDAEPGGESNREPYLPPCEHCGGEGVMDAIPPLDQYETVIVVHRDV